MAIGLKELNNRLNTIDANALKNTTNVQTTFAIKLRITLTCSQVKVVRTTTVVVRVLLAAQVALAAAQGLRQVVVGRLVRQTVYQAVAAAARAVALRALVVVAARAQAAVLGLW